MKKRKKLCNLNGCLQPAVRKGMCQHHHDKLRRHGDPFYEKELVNEGQCSIEGCASQAYKKGMCNAHYIRMRRFGRTERVLAPVGTPRKSVHGYEVIHTGGHNGQQRHLHRLIMERHIGRSLTADEHIHHINGNKLDNRIENLEICSNSEHRKKHATKEYREELSRRTKLWHQTHKHPMQGTRWSKEMKAKMRLQRLGKPRAGKKTPISALSLSTPEESCSSQLG